MGGKPSKCTPADRRLKQNRDMPMKAMPAKPMKAMPPTPRGRPARKGSR